MDLQKMKEKFEEAFELCERLQNKDPENEAEKLFRWILNTNINRFDIFVDPADANLCSNIQGLEAFYYIIHHALYDDGELTFVSINNKPQIIRVHPFDFENKNAFFQHLRSLTFKSELFDIENEYDILKINVDEFIEKAEQYEVAHIKSCFLSDVEMDTTPEKTEAFVKHYKAEHPDVFDENWIKEIKPWN